MKASNCPADEPRLIPIVDISRPVEPPYLEAHALIDRMPKDALEQLLPELRARAEGPVPANVRVRRPFGDLTKPPLRQDAKAPASDHRALVVDDDSAVVDEVAEILTSMGHDFDTAGSQEEARKLLKANTYTYVLLDLQIPVRAGCGKPRVQNGENLLEEIAAASTALPVIVMTDLSAETPNVAVKIMRLATSIARKGAADFIDKPFPTAGRTLDRVIRKNIAKRAVPRQESKSAEPRTFKGGQLVFHADHVELCGVKVLGDLGLGHMRGILDTLLEKKDSDRFVAFSGAELARRIGAKGGQNTVAGCIRDFRNGVTERLRDEANILCDRQDVIQSGGRGYRLADWIEVVDRRAGSSAGSSRGHAGSREGSSVGSRGHDPANDPARSGNDPAAAPDDPLSDRQHWVLDQLRKGVELQRDAFQKQFGIAPKTAKRDLTDLRRRGLIEFVRTPRPGHYRLKKRGSKP